MNEDYMKSWCYDVYQVNLFNDEFDKEFVDGIKNISSIIQDYE